MRSLQPSWKELEQVEKKADADWVRRVNKEREELAEILRSTMIDKVEDE